MKLSELLNLKKDSLKPRQRQMAIYAGFTPKELEFQTHRWYQEHKEEIHPKNITGPGFPRQHLRVSERGVDEIDVDTYEHLKAAIVHFMLADGTDLEFIAEHQKELERAMKKFEHDNSRSQRPKMAQPETSRTKLTLVASAQPEGDDADEDASAFFNSLKKKVSHG